MVESHLSKFTCSRKQPTTASFRAATEDKYHGILSPSVVYIHFYIFLSLLSLPSTRSSPVAALPFSPGVVRLPSHHVMTCRLSDLARGKAARFEPRNDRQRRARRRRRKGPDGGRGYTRARRRSGEGRGE